ncbi:TRM11 family SAM-dependent methyltransferase [Streptacidiphilus monticola]
MSHPEPSTRERAPLTLAQLPTSVWVTAQQDARTQRKDRYLPESVEHPGKMLPAIGRHAIRAYTRPGDTVLDPMCGIGTTLVEAVHLGRHAIGIELEHRWPPIARGNLRLAHDQGATGAGTVYQGDARHTASLIDPEQHGLAQLLLTSPPYGSSLHGHIRSTRDTGEPGIRKFHHTYGTSPANLAHAPTDTLLASFTTILASCRPCSPTAPRWQSPPAPGANAANSSTCPPPSSPPDKPRASSPWSAASPSSRACATGTWSPAAPSTSCETSARPAPAASPCT